MKIVNIKVLILIIFFTGILQIDILGIEWKYLTIISVLHAFASIMFAVFYIIPFVNRHAYKYIIIKKVNSINGWILGFILLLCILSGFYLFFVGNRGGDIIGIYSFNIHLYSSLLLLVFLFFHTKGKVQKIGTLLFFMSFVTTIVNPISLYSYDKKFTSIELEYGKSSYHNEDWTNSTKCKSCHEEIFNQWANSNHKNLVESNPYYMVMEAVAGEVEGEEFKQWCMGCHNPSGLTTGLTRTSHNMTGNMLTDTLFEKDAKTLVENFEKDGNSRLEEGVSCIACHRIMDAKEDGNASYTLDLINRKNIHLKMKNQL